MIKGPKGPAQSWKPDSVTQASNRGQGLLFASGEDVGFSSDLKTIPEVRTPLSEQWDAAKDFEINGISL